MKELTVEDYRSMLAMSVQENAQKDLMILEYQVRLNNALAEINALRGDAGGTDA